MTAHCLDMNLRCNALMLAPTLALMLATGECAQAKDIQVTAGDYTTCAWVKNDVAKCWGLNASGQLGQGDTTTRGIVAGQLGSALPAINFGSGRTASRIAAGSFHVCALLDNGQVKCWGDNGVGQLGTGGTGGRAAQPSQLGTDDNWQAVAAGGVHSMALRGLP